MRLLLFFLALNLTLWAQEDFNSLLNAYKAESDLSHITKRESAGFVDVYTRSDLEMMQVKTFQDILRIIPGLHYTRTSNNLTSLSKPSTSNIKLTSTRLYVNDHDMSSSSFGSAFIIWGELPLEYIDHIEVYKGSSSIEFGNETASLVIKLYTKTPQREEGRKVRLTADTKKSTMLDAYVASTDDDFSYFAYANLNNIKRKKYDNLYNAQNYTLPSDRLGHNLYANLNYKDLRVELGSYAKESDSFLGIGTHRTPQGGKLDAYQHYIHITQKFSHDIKLQLSYDKASYKRSYIDPNGIHVANMPTINYYGIHFEDEILSVILEKQLRYEKHSLLVGTFYKQKKFKEHGDFYDNAQTYTHQNSFSNTLNLSSIYAEYSYDYDPKTKLIASVKEDFFQYKKDVKDTNELVSRVGVIKNIHDFQIKAFGTYSYVPTPFYQLYNPDNKPYKANPNLKNMPLMIASLSVRYKKEKHDLELIFAKNRAKNFIIYDRSTPYGYKNSSSDARYTRYQLKYTYNIDNFNKLILDAYTGNNNKHIVISPQYAANIRLFNRYKKFDIYNELLYKSSYSYANLYMDASFNYSCAVKYHLNKDFSLGLRGENLFNDSFEQAYRGYKRAIAVTDQKVWFNMEYLF